MAVKPRIAMQAPQMWFGGAQAGNPCHHIKSHTVAAAISTACRMDARKRVLTRVFACMTRVCGCVHECMQACIHVRTRVCLCVYGLHVCMGTCVECK